MPVIVNSYKSDNSLGDTISSLGAQLFGKDALTGDVLREKSRGMRRNNEAIDQLQRQAATPGGVSYEDPNARAAAYGLDSPKEAFEAQRGISANRYGAMDPRTTNATVGAGGNYASTGQGFTASEANTMARAKMSADTAAQTAIRTAEMTPMSVIDRKTGLTTVKSRAQAIRDGDAPVLNHSEVQGTRLDQNFGNLGTLTPQQQHAVGAFVPYGQTEAGFGTEQDNAMRRAEMTADRAAHSAERTADMRPINVIDPDTGLPYVTSTRDSIENRRRPVLGASEEQGILRGQGFRTGYAGQNPSQLVASGAQPSAEHLYNWTDTGPSGEVLQGRTNDGRTDLTTGQPLTANARVTGVNNASALKDQLVPTNTNLTHIQEKHANNSDLLQMTKQATQLIDANPFATGATGRSIDYAQRAQLGIAQMGAFLGKGKDWQSGLENVKMEAAQKLGPAAAQLFPSIYNPAPDQLSALYGMLTYKTAQALFGQEGRGLNIEDVRRTQEILGNASNWTTNPQELKARLNMVSQYAQQNVANAEAKINQHNALKQGGPLGMPPGAQPALAMPGATEEWGRGPDGRPVRLR